MVTPDLDPAIATALVDRQLLRHPFYLRWERGEVSMEDLGAYAAQYRYFERFLPEFLHQLVADLPEGPARDLVAANLTDEAGDPVPHVELFERFASAVAAGDDGPSPAMSELLAAYRQLLASGPLAALAGFMAYESQASDVAQRKAEGLRLRYGLNDRAVSFWDHHASTDVRHALWAERALGHSTDSPADLIPSIRLAADAWWAFLDEREELAEAS